MDWLTLLALCSVVGLAGYVALKRREANPPEAGKPATLAEHIRQSIDEKAAGPKAD